MRRLLTIALTTTALPCLSATVARSQVQAVPAAVAACSANPVLCAVVVTTAGWLLYWRNQPPTLCTWATCKPLRIDDPDKPIEEVWITNVWGVDDRDAENRCRQEASKIGVVFSRIRRTSQNRKQNAPYECFGFTNHPEAFYDPRRR